MTYSQKLRDPRWQKKRLEILQRDNWKCVVCLRADKPLQVHHGVYARREPWDYPDYIYQTLCEDCHPIRQELTDRLVGATRLMAMAMSTETLRLEAQKAMASAMITFPNAKDMP